MIFIDAIEAGWIVVNLLTAVVTVVALLDAISDRRAIRNGKGTALRLTARGNVRREFLRLLVQVLLLSVVVPGLFVDRPVTLSFAVLALITVPVVLLFSSVADFFDRRSLSSMTLSQITAEREARLDELSALVRKGNDAATQAYETANDVNAKLATVTKVAEIVQGEMRDTAQDTNAKVTQVRDRVVKDGA